MRAKYFTHDRESYYPIPQTSMEFANVNFIQPLRGGRKGGPKTAKPHGNMPKKPQTASDFSPNTETANLVPSVSHLTAPLQGTVR